jgi:hypothetical protein
MTGPNKDKPTREIHLDRLIRISMEAEQKWRARFLEKQANKREVKEDNP